MAPQLHLILILSTKTKLDTLEALAHYNWNYKKKFVTLHTHYNFFFTTVTIFSTVSYMGNFVVCKGLNFSTKFQNLWVFQVNELFL